MARTNSKAKKVEKDRSERWLLTYSDMMNLLLILFIVLYCMSKIDAARAVAVSEAIKQGFSSQKMEQAQVKSGQPNYTTETATQATVVPESVARGPDYQELYEDLMKLVKEKGLQGKIIVKITGRGVIISLSDAVLFARGSADVNAESANLIVSIGEILREVGFSQLVIEGFTDSDPIHTAQFKDNRALSSERANNVARILQYNCQIPPEKISSLGYGEYRPVAPNDTPENKAKNRRIVITILKQDSGVDAVMSASDLAKTIEPPVNDVSSGSAGAH